MNSLKSHVNAKVLAVVIPLLLVLLILGTFLLRNHVVNTINTGYEANLRHEMVTVEQALQQALMNNDFLTVQKVVANLSHHSQIEGIRVLDLKGNILASSVPNEVGVRLDLNSEPCQSCHAGKYALEPSIQQVSVNYTGDQVMVTAKGLENQVACQSCHSSDGETLGVILTEHDPAQVETLVTELTLGIYGGAGALFLLLSGVFLFSFSHWVGRPLHSLASNGTNPSLFTRQDEFGELARQFQNLNTVVKEKGDRLDAQRRNIQALLSLSESIDVSLTREKVLQFALGKVQEVTGFTNIAMRLFDPKQKCFRLVAQNGMSSRMVEDLLSIPAEIGFTGDVYRTHRAAYTSDLASDPRLESPAPIEFGFRSLVSVPFLSGDRLMGSMELASKEKHLWSEDEVRWLELMGRSIGNVLHHIETSDQLQGMAVIQERARIAQEIHDGLAQLIGTLRLWADEAQLALHEKNLQEVQKDLQKIELTAQDAYAGLREEILGLRDTLMPGKEIVSVIREFLNRYQRQWGIETQLLVNQNQLDGNRRLSIAPAAEIQLLRIIQEGLTNVRRHANASRIVVSMQDGGEYLRVEIRDNGQGFDTHNVPEETLGLRIMRERAATVGGVVTVKSSIGEGTNLIVELPKQTTPAKFPPEIAGLEKEE